LNSTKVSKRLVFISSRFPYPIEKGDKLRAYYQLKDLSKDWEIHLISLSDRHVEEKDLAAIKPFCKEMHVLRISKWLGYLRVFFGLFGSRPLQTYYFTTLLHKIKVNRILKNTKPDHIFAQLIRTTEYVKNYHNCPKTLDYMDALSAGVQMRISLSPLIVRWLFTLEWRRLRHYENVIFEYFEKHIIIASQDREQLIHPKRHSIHVFPNGVNESFLNYNASEQIKIFDLCFVGNLSYQPNIEAVKYLVNDILPALEKRGKKLSVLISGANPTSAVKQFQNKVTLTGWVDDIRSSYTQSKIFVAPMFIGTGLQNKLLEAMALGLPCITTPLAHKALGCDSDTVSIAKNADEFADEIIRLLENENNQHQALRARAFIAQNFNWTIINASLSETMSIRNVFQK